MTALEAIRTSTCSSSEGAEWLQEVVATNLRGEGGGVYSVCCSHPLVIEAAVDQAIADGSCLLVEATANQVNQFGGYTGMQPADFRNHVLEIAERRGLPAERVILGGDHLGPVCWASEPADAALEKAAELVRGFAEAGFSKIHLDCSMPLAGDPPSLDDAVVAERAARLCSIVEETAKARFGGSSIVYVIGTEVPPPGGADETLGAIEPTPAERARHTLDIHREAFARHGLRDAWSRVIALVVQPGVEFDHSAVVDYVPEKAAGLKALAEVLPDRIAFEAHSTDYQRPLGFFELVQDHFAVLKVGPALTFAMREALFALSHIEDELIDPENRSDLRAVCEARMLAQPKYWQRFYEGTAEQQALMRRYSLSDRIRYYWPDPAVEAAVAKMLANLEKAQVPLGLLSQFLPSQFQEVRAGLVEKDPRSLVKARVREALRPYALACAPKADGAQ